MKKKYIIDVLYFSMENTNTINISTDEYTFTCPISQCLFRKNNIIMAADGIMYDKDAFEYWVVQEKKTISPKTGEELPNLFYVKAYLFNTLYIEALQSNPLLLEQYMVDHPDATVEEIESLSQLIHFIDTMTNTTETKIAILFKKCVTFLRNTKDLEHYINLIFEKTKHIEYSDDTIYDLYSTTNILFPFVIEYIKTINNEYIAGEHLFEAPPIIVFLWLMAKKACENDHIELAKILIREKLYSKYNNIEYILQLHYWDCGEALLDTIFRNGSYKCLKEFIEYFENNFYDILYAVCFECKKNKSKLVKILLEEEEDPYYKNRKNSIYNTIYGKKDSIMLHLIKINCYDTLCMLLEYGMKPCCIQEACCLASTKILIKLLDYINITEIIDDEFIGGYTFLHYICMYGRIKVLEYIVNNPKYDNIAYDVLSKDNMTVMHILAKYKKHQAVKRKMMLMIINKYPSIMYNKKDSYNKLPVEYIDDKNFKYFDILFAQNVLITNINIYMLFNLPFKNQVSINYNMILCKEEQTEQFKKILYHSLGKANDVESLVKDINKNIMDISSYKCEIVRLHRLLDIVANYIPLIERRDQPCLPTDEEYYYIV